MPRSKAEVEPTDSSGSSRGAATGRETGVDCKSASLLVCCLSSSCSLEGGSRDASSNFLGGGFDTQSGRRRLGECAVCILVNVSCFCRRWERIVTMGVPAAFRMGGLEKTTSGFLGLLCANRAP